ncbi:MAG: MBL fold metallo-hydrolase [Erysipelotrichia bacterium]|nr:MBL fold metallo-hydrolase [Erysipelotrichia bacterium]
MYLKVLCDNNSIIDHYFLAEPALSFYIEDNEHKILFDLGYSNVFRQNSDKMKIDLKEVDTIVFSHGHNDHTGGLRYITDFTQSLKVVCHPNTDEKKYYCGLDISAPINFNDLPDNFEVIKTEQPYRISEHITYMGQIKRNVQHVDPLEDDNVYDDSAMVYENEKGIFIITGCSHSGICNIIDQAINLTGKRHIIGIIGGFHMLNNKNLNKEVCDYFSRLDIENCYPCHCTDLQAKIALSKVVKVNDVGVDFDIEI